MSQSSTGPVTFHPLFPVTVLETNVTGADAINAPLKEAIMARREQSPGMIRSNVAGWHSDLQMMGWGGEAAKTLAVAMLETCVGRTQDRGMKDNVPRYEMGIEMWANISPAGASNQFHCHPGCLWSGVYYVDDGGDPEANLILQDPNFPMNRAYAPDLEFVADDGTKFPSIHEFSPTPGRLIIFPSWLAHAVKPHNGIRARISVAMNVTALPLPPSGVVPPRNGAAI